MGFVSANKAGTFVAVPAEHLVIAIEGLQAVLSYHF